MKERAYADMEAAQKHSLDEGTYKFGLAVLFCLFGEGERALPMIEELIPNVGESLVTEEWIAECYAMLGNREEFFEWIDKAMSVKMISGSHLRYCVGFDKVRDDPRFPEIFRKLGLSY